jgi:arylsulfatase A-like enzyme
MTQPPNLIYLFADQLRYQSCGFAGDAKAQTPNMEQLAAESVNFINATSSLCQPVTADARPVAETPGCAE